MEIQKTFELSYPPALVWDAFSDVHLVVSCLPGASIVEQLGDDRYKGQFSVKVGPLAAAFDGEVGIERKPADRTGVVSGKGADARSSSRASGTMSYRVEEGDAPERTRVAVVCEINLAGALAQFGKAAIIREIANRITAEFVRNFEARLASTAVAAAAAAECDAGMQASSAPAPASGGGTPANQPAQSLDAGRFIWAILRDRILSFFRLLIGRRAQN